MEVGWQLSVKIELGEGDYKSGWPKNIFNGYFNGAIENFELTGFGAIHYLKMEKSISQSRIPINTDWSLIHIMR